MKKQKTEAKQDYMIINNRIVSYQEYCDYLFIQDFVKKLPYSDQIGKPTEYNNSDKDINSGIWF